MSDLDKTGLGGTRWGSVYPRTSANRVAVACVPANEMSLCGNEGSGVSSSHRASREPAFQQTRP